MAYISSIPASIGGIKGIYIFPGIYRVYAGYAQDACAQRKRQLFNLPSCIQEILILQNLIKLIYARLLSIVQTPVLFLLSYRYLH